MSLGGWWGGRWAPPPRGLRPLLVDVGVGGVHSTPDCRGGRGEGNTHRRREGNALFPLRLRDRRRRWQP